MNYLLSREKRAGRFVFYGSAISFLAYSLQGVVYPSGSAMSQAMLAIYLAFGTYCFFARLLKRDKSMAEKVMLCFFLLVAVTFVVSPKIVHGVTNEAIGRVSTWGQFKNIACFCLSYFIGAYCYSKGTVNSKMLAKAGIAFMSIMILRFFIAMFTMKMTYRGFMVQNNAAYPVVLCLPFLPLIFKHYKKIAIALLLLSIATVIAGAKRGAIVCLCVGLLAMGIYYLRNIKINIKTVIAGFVVVVGLAWFAIDQYNKSDLLKQRLEMTQKKGLGPREIAYRSLLRHWEETPSLRAKLLGEGTAQSIEIWGNYAHNDWLELLVDNGLAGVVLYALFFVACFKGIKRYRGFTVFKLAGLVAVMLSLTRSLFSMGFTDLFGGLDMMLIGFVTCPRLYQPKHIKLM